MILQLPVPLKRHALLVAVLGVWLVAACDAPPSHDQSKLLASSSSNQLDPVIAVVTTIEDPDLRIYLEKLVETATLDPSDSNRVAQLCMALDANGFDQAAETCYEETTTRFPGDYRTHYLLSVRQHKNGNLEHALVSLQTALDVKPNQPAASIRLGNWQLDAGRFEAARIAFTQAVKSGAGPAAELGLAKSLLKLNEIDQAHDLLTAISTRTQHPVALRYLGEAWRAKGNEANARRYLLAASESRGMWFDDPLTQDMRKFAKSVGKRLHQVELALNAGLTDEALNTLREIESEGTVDFNLHYHFALAYFETKQFDAARLHLLNAIELEPVHFPSHLLLAALYQRQDDNSKALDHLQQVVHIFPNLQVAHQELGFVQLRLSDFDGALTSFRNAINLDSTAPNVHYYAGVILGERGSCTEALDHFKNALRLEPGHEKAAIGKRTCEQDLQSPSDFE